MAASVLGERIDPLVLAEVTGHPAARVGELLDQAVAHGALLSSPYTAGLSFAHALVRDAVYDTLAPSRRMALHERAARALERSPGGAAAGQIAGHWRRSGGPDWPEQCVRWAGEAARRAAASLAHDEAARFTTLALEAADAAGADVGLRAELTLDGARAEFAAGHVEASLARCQAAARLAGEADRPDILASAALVITGMGDPATNTAVDVLCASAMTRQAHDVLLVRVAAPVTHLLLGERDLARATFEEFRHLPGTLEVGPRWVALMVQIGIAAVWLDDTETADRVYRELSGLPPTYMADGSGVVSCAGSLQRVIGDLALATGRLDEAIRRYTDAIEMNGRIGARPFLALSRLGLARSLLAKADPGDLPAARALVTEAAAEFRRFDLPGPLAAADTLLADIDSAARTASPLSPRESEVASLIALAMSNRQIAERLVLSERTVEAHVRSILAKLGYSTRTEIATWALRGASDRRAPRSVPTHQP